MLNLDKQAALERILSKGKRMSIDAQGWFSWMIKDPGPLEKTNGGVNTCKIAVPHSAEGYWPYLGTLLKDPNRRASWMFSNLKDGRCFQHYSIYAQVWGSGSGYPNNNGVMWENEGVAGEAFTEAQTANCTRIIREVSELKGWVPRRPTDANDKTATLFEHRECVRFGSSYTACPSGRVPWDTIMQQLEEDMPLNDQDKQAIAAIVTLQLELFRQELEKAGQLQPRK